MGKVITRATLSCRTDGGGQRSDLILTPPLAANNVEKRHQGRVVTMQSSCTQRVIALPPACLKLLCARSLNSKLTNGRRHLFFSFHNFFQLHYLSLINNPAGFIIIAFLAACKQQLNFCRSTYKRNRTINFTGCSLPGYNLTWCTAFDRPTSRLRSLNIGWNSVYQKMFGFN